MEQAADGGECTVSTDNVTTTDSSHTLGGKPPRTRIVCADALNIVACFAVVVLHCSLTVFGPARDTSWSIALVWQSASIFAVPVFFMISGMNLIGYRDRQTTEHFFKRRLLKVGGALLFGSIVCYVLYCAFPSSFFGGEKFAGTFGLIDFVKRFLTNDINDTYWFLYAIIYLYLLTPILSLIAKNKRCIQYILALCLCVSVLIPLVEKMGFNPMYFGTLFNWPLFSSVSLLYYLGGYYLHTYTQPLTRNGRVVALVFVIVSVAGMALSGFQLNAGASAKPGMSYDPFFTDTASPFCVMLAFSLFLLFQSSENWLKRRKPISLKRIRTVSGLSLDIYLFHVMVINWLGTFVPPNVKDVFLMFPIAEAALVYALTALLAFAGKWTFAHAKDAITKTVHQNG